MKASAPRTGAAAVVRLFAMMDRVDPALRKALEDGTYVVDPYAVAEAMLRRREQLAEARRLSKVLVATKVDDGAVEGADLDEPAAGADVA
jgi:Anti-sigma-28 factor, FlgM